MGSYCRARPKSLADKQLGSSNHSAAAYQILAVPTKRNLRRGARGRPGHEREFEGAGNPPHSRDYQDLDGEIRAGDSALSARRWSWKRVGELGAGEVGEPRTRGC